MLTDTPPWPPLAGVAALVATYVATTVVLALLAVVAGVAGYDPEEVPAGGLLVVTAALSAAAVGVCVAIARRTGRVEPADFALRRPAAADLAVGVAAGAAVLAVVTGVWAWLTVQRTAFPLPPELSDASAVELATVGAAPGSGDVELGPALIASALARAVLAPVAAQVVLLGFVAPALARWRGGPVPAIGVAVLGLTLVAGVAGDLGGGLLVPALALAALLVALRVLTGSLVPGVVLACGAAGAALGASAQLGAAGIAALAAACAVAGVVLVAPILRDDAP